MLIVRKIRELAVTLVLPTTTAVVPFRTAVPCLALLPSATFKPWPAEAMSGLVPYQNVGPRKQPLDPWMPTCRVR